MAFVRWPLSWRLGNLGNQPIIGNRNFVLLWSGNAFSLIGFHGARIAYPLLTLSMTGSLTAAGWVGFALTAPGLVFQLPAGFIADRFDRIRILTFCQLVGMMATSVTVFAVLAGGRRMVVLIAAAAFVEGTVYVFAAVCEFGLVRDIVPTAQRPVAFAFLGAEQPIALLIGRALGGAIYGVARWLPFAANIVSYLYCLSALLSIRPRRIGARRLAADGPPGMRAVFAGFHTVWHEPLLRASTTAVGVTNVVVQIVLLVILAELLDSEYPAWMPGLVLAAAGAGGILSASIAPWLTTRYTAQRIYLASLWTWAGLMVPIAISSHPVVLAVGWGGIGAVGVLCNIALNTYRAAVIPEELIGRAMAAMGLFSNGAVALGALGAGYLLSAFGADAVRWIALPAMCMVAVIGARAAALHPEYPQSAYRRTADHHPDGELPAAEQKR